MIWESWVWKQPLLEMADRLIALKAVEELSDEDIVQVEKDILIGFYSVRKLIELPTKITDATKAITVTLIWYPAKRSVNWRNLYKSDELYDFSTVAEETRDLLFVCGRIIHSVILMPSVNETGGLDGILFTSDNDMNKKLYFADIDIVIGVFNKVGEDDPSEIRWRRDPGSGDESLEVN